MDFKAVALLNEAEELLIRFSTEYVSGQCRGCRWIAVTRGGESPVVDPVVGIQRRHRRECPVGKHQRRVKRYMDK